ncbi:DNA (cytosine-5)-methyltransferase 1B-like [Coffea eugenioides]|uniref:DNA (cytosine-5)-methyltransferase 1B-like n=1 Tax=Coffea eugenioides TaxID=49369 RepID=UPI000F6068F9|nr:DNA (cytosine-5)-methyltransferase 1B-like [Coffea eugenioides]
MAASKQLPFFTEAASFAPMPSSNRISITIFGHMVIVELCTAHINQWWKLYKVQRMKRVEDFEREKRKRIFRGGGRKERAKVTVNVLSDNSSLVFHSYNRESEASIEFDISHYRLNHYNYLQLKTNKRFTIILRVCKLQKSFTCVSHFLGQEMIVLVRLKASAVTYQKMEKTEIQGKDLKRSRAKTKASSKPLKRKRSESNGSGSRKIPKKEAASSISHCKAIFLTDKSTTVETESFQFRNEEAAAIQLTRVCRDDFLPNRRLTAFVFHDEFGEPQPVEMVEECNLYISGLILPLEDACDDEKETRIRCEGFGPIISWSLSGYDDNSPIIWVSTEAADYECIKPATVYQKQYSLFFQKACTCVEVYRELSKSCGGNPNLSLNQLLTAIDHSVTERTNVPRGASVKDLIISWGRFIHDQLIGLDETAPKNDTIFRNLPVLVSLRDASDKAAGLASTRTKLKRRKNKVFSSTKIEYDIADNYPPPAYYQRGINEIDERAVFKGETDDADQLPHHVLHNWCLYGFDGSFISLEFLQLNSSSVIEQQIYCSGIATIGDGSRFCLDTCSNSPSSPTVINADRIPVYLSTIKDWKIEFKSSTVSISIRTDIAWYRLANPLTQYGPWYEPVLKTVTLAVSIAELLKEQRRASRLSFPEIVKRISDFNEGHPAYISSISADVERYIFVHGQTILKLFANYPDPSIRKCAFVRGLRDNLKELHRSKLVKKKIFPSQKEHVNLEAAVPHKTSETKAMPATTTKLISRIWHKYCSKYLPEDFNYEDTEALQETKSIFDENFKKFYCVPKRKSQCASTKVRWDREEVGKTSSGEVFYKRANFDGLVVSVGDSVQVKTADSEESPPVFFIEYMFEDSDARKLAHGRLMLRGYQTVLGYVSDKRELFLTNHCQEFGLSDIIGTMPTEIQSVPWGYQHRKTNADNHKIDRARVDKKIKGKPTKFFCRSLYCPERGAFLCLKTSSMGLGTGYCDSCKIKELRNTSVFKLSRYNFTFKGTKCHIHDFVYVTPHSISDETDKTPKNARSVVLKPFTVCQFLGIDQHKPFKNADPESTIVKLRRFFRPEDISADKAYHSDIREIYYSEQVIKVPVVAVKGKCEVREKEDLNPIPTTYVSQHIFFCEQLYDPISGALQKLPLQVKRSLSQRKSGKTALNRRTSQKRKKGERGFRGEFADCNKFLATLDIFAGCGGLSSGLEQSGVSKTKWAIEYEKSASEAFQLNHPDATVFTRNCNVILRAIMTVCGDADDCISTAEAADLADKLEQKEIDGLPRPGDVEFIIGGPPCQGFSKMNRYKERSWSKVQCEMILAFLSFVDYFRPKFFLLENVRNFIFFNKGQIFRFTLASLLEMGYQVRFGILEAGAYGVSQNRKRAFIWAASPEENLPEWPEPMYVFKGPRLKIPLGGNIHYAAVGSTANGAPFRAITIRDTIGELPAVRNGALKPIMEYKNGPISWFQNQIRGDIQDLKDHISKEMNELNLLRCRKIPKRPGSDWHDLPDKQVELSNGKVVNLLPSWLLKTAGRNNQWKGLYGRLDWAGKFPTCITDPQPMGKVGRWFHPAQDRILTVREYARAQGFPDSYQFAGNIQQKHRQVGNAVPLPLAFALGRKLNESIEDTSSELT